MILKQTLSRFCVCGDGTVVRLSFTNTNDTPPVITGTHPEASLSAELEAVVLPAASPPGFRGGVGPESLPGFCLDEAGFQAVNVEL